VLLLATYHAAAPGNFNYIYIYIYIKENSQSIIIIIKKKEKENKGRRISRKDIEEGTWEEAINEKTKEEDP
jgi:hypothetical protein